MSIYIYTRGKWIKIHGFYIYIYTYDGISEASYTECAARVAADRVGGRPFSTSDREPEREV